MRPLLSATPQPDEQRIVSYLESGYVTSASGHVKTDAFEPSKQIGPISIRSDGVWTWPSLLAYYVATYHCKLPEEFVEYIRSVGAS